MSGSLNIISTGGQWTAKTASPCPLGVSQSLFSTAGWVRVNSYTPAVLNVRAINSTGFFLNININVGLLFPGIASLAGNLSTSKAFTLGKTYHVAMTYNSTVGAKFYFDGVLTSSTLGSFGNTGAGANPVTIGWPNPSAIDFMMADWGVYNGTELSIANIVRLRDRSVTHAALGATSHWSLGGPIGQNPVQSADGMLDLIGSNHLIAVPGVGNSSTTAVYSGTNLTYVSPVTVDKVHVCRSGEMIHVTIGTNPALGTAVPAYVTAVNADPVFRLNGNVISTIRIWSEVGHDHPCVAYQPYTPGSPPQPIHISPSDVLTWEAPDSWVTTSQGIAADETGTAENASGGYETASFSYSGFGLTAAPPTMGLGFNSSPFTFSDSTPIKNVTHRASNPWSSALTSTPDGYPLTLSSFGSVSSGVWGARVNNGINNAKVPNPTGDLVITGDEWLPATPMVGSLISLTGQNAAITPSSAGTITPGVVDGSGHEIGKKWTWNIGIGTTTYDIQPYFTLTAPLPHVNGQAQTLKNMQWFIGGDTPEVASGTNTSENFIRMLTADNGNVSPYTRYLMDSDGANSWVRPADLPSEDLFSYSLLAPVTNWWTGTPGLTKDRILPIYAIRPYTLATSPNVYTAQKYNSRFITSDGPSDFMIPLAANGLDYDWLQPNQGDVGRVVLEFEVADSLGNPVNHNLESGQFIGFDSFATVFVVNSVDGSGTKTCQISGFPIVWVTGPNKFIVQFASTLPNAPQMGTAASRQIINITAHTALNSAGMMPLECLTGPCRKTNGDHGLYITVNHALNDDGIRALAQRIFDSCPRGTEVLVQWSNEILISNVHHGWLQQLGRIEGFWQADPASYEAVTAMQRTHECHEIFADVWGADAGSLVRLFQPFTNVPLQTFQAMTYAKNNNILIHGLAIAYYISLGDVAGPSAPSWKNAAARIIADNPDSYVYTNPQTVPKISRAAYADLARFYLKYNGVWNGPNGPAAAHHNQMVLSGYGDVFPIPYLVGYECGLCTLIAAGISTTSIIPRAGLTMDMTYDPSFYDVCHEYWHCLQQPGPVGTAGFTSVAHVNLTQGRAAGGPAYTVVGGAHPGNDSGFTQPWGVYMYQTQQAGYGLANQFWANDGLAHDYPNESPMAQAAHDWIAGQGEGPPPTVSFEVSPIQIAENQSSAVTLTLIGTGTSWTNGSVVSVANSLTGTTTVTPGMFTAIASTFAALQVTTGAGAGTWQLTIDGVASGILSVGSQLATYASPRQGTVIAASVDPRQGYIVTG